VGNVQTLNQSSEIAVPRWKFMKNNRPRDTIPPGNVNPTTALVSRFYVNYIARSGVPAMEMKIVPTGIVRWDQHPVPSSSILLWFGLTMMIISLPGRSK